MLVSDIMIYAADKLFIKYGRKKFYNRGYLFFTSPLPPSFRSIFTRGEVYKSYLSVSSVFPVNFSEKVSDIFLASSVRYFIEAAATRHRR